MNKVRTMWESDKIGTVLILGCAVFCLLNVIFLVLLGSITNLAGALCSGTAFFLYKDRI